MLNIFAKIKNRVLQERQSLCDAVRDPAAAPWGKWLFWSFWISLASFPIGYGAREILPVVSFICLLFYYRYNWQQSVLRRLDAKPLFYCLWAMIAIGVVFSEHIWVSVLHAGTGINKGFILPFIAMECVRSEQEIGRAHV